MSLMDHTPAAPALATVVPIGRHPSVFPPGAEARHAEHGWVFIEQANGNERRVRWYGFRDVPEAEFSEWVDADGDPVIAEQEITMYSEWVACCSLRKIDDPYAGRPADWQRLKQLGALRLPIAVVDRYIRSTLSRSREKHQYDCIENT